MGNWNINIQGVGSHHNIDNEADADRMFAEFVKSLKGTGQHIEHATFTYGAKQTPHDVAEYVKHHQPLTAHTVSVSGTAE